MSNNDFSIDAAGNIVESERQVTIRQDGGALIAEYGRTQDHPVTNILQKGERAPTQIRHESGGHLEIGPNGSRYVGPMTTHETSRRGHGNEGILATAQDMAGRSCADLRQVAANPANFTMEFAGTRASVQSLLQLGFLVIDGDGSFNLNSRAIMNAARNRG
jgi:hypothetical protein